MFKRSHLTNYCAHVVMSFTFIESPPTHQQESSLHEKLLGSVDSYNVEEVITTQCESV